MTVHGAREELAKQYASIAVKGFPIGTLPPFNRWLEETAQELSIDPREFMSQVRVAAMPHIKVYLRSPKAGSRDVAARH